MLILILELIVLINLQKKKKKRNEKQVKKTSMKWGPDYKWFYSFYMWKEQFQDITTDSFSSNSFSYVRQKLLLFLLCDVQKFQLSQMNKY